MWLVGVEVDLADGNRASTTRVPLAVPPALARSLTLRRTIGVVVDEMAPLTSIAVAADVDPATATASPRDRGR